MTKYYWTVITIYGTRESGYDHSSSEAALRLSLHTVFGRGVQIMVEVAS